MLTEELMQKVRRLQIITGRRVDELFAGEYNSAFKGLGMEFAEVREYQPGDDIRTIDWNVTARTGVPHIKRFKEERELTVMLVVDLSASGLFGSISQFKSELAAELCAVLALAATRNNDKIGLLIFTDRIELHIPPKKGVRHVQRIIREVLGFEPQGRGTKVALALDHLLATLKKKSVVFLVSDFVDDDFLVPLRILARRHDVVTALVSDPRELITPNVGMIELEDAETGRIITFDTGAKRVRRELNQRETERRDQLASDLCRAGVDIIPVSTGTPYVQALIEFFRTRERRRKRGRR